LEIDNTDSNVIRCMLWQNCITFQANEDEVHQWECSFDVPSGNNDGGYENKLLVGPGNTPLNEFLELNGAESGQSVLIAREADIRDDRIIVSKDRILAIEPILEDDKKEEGSSFSHRARLRGVGAGADGDNTNQDNRRQRYRRRLARPSTGELLTLVVRVSTRDSAPPSSSDLSTDVFNDEYCLKSQYNRCSFGQLQIREYLPGEESQINTTAPGVIDILLQDTDANGNTKEAIQELANAQLRNILGVSDPGSIFDLVLFCMPPGMGEWLAYAYLGRWDSYYNNDMCQSVSQQMHEVGHNLGLHHSGEYHGSDTNQEYGDKTDLMGFSYRSDDTPAMCFNPAKSWQLGWYRDRVVDVDVDKDLSTDAKSFVLNGVVDYGGFMEGDGDEGNVRYVVVKVKDYYIGFNRATGFNEGVQEAVDMVTVVEKLGSPTSSAKSKLVGRLRVGDTYKIEVTPLLTVEVFYASNDNARDAVVEVSVAGDAVECTSAFAEVTVELVTDQYPEETSWGISDSNGQFLVYRDGYHEEGTKFSTVVGELCKGAEYFFVIQDLYGDGICCDLGSGSYKVRYGDLVLLEGGSFGAEEVLPFTVSDDLENAFSIAQTPENIIDLTSCSDKPDFVYRDDPEKDCDWVGQGSDKNTKIRCLRRASSDLSDTRKVYQYCRKTCDDVGIKNACPENITE